MEAITIHKVEVEPMTIKEYKDAKGLPMTAYDRPWEEGYEFKEYCRVTGDLLGEKFIKTDVFNSLYTTVEIVEGCQGREGR